MRDGTPLVADVYRMGARDQRPNEARPDMLVYTSEELAKGYTVSLGVYDTLYAASSAPDTDFVARLVHVSIRTSGPSGLRMGSSGPVSGRAHP